MDTFNVYVEGSGLCLSSLQTAMSKILSLVKPQVIILSTSQDPSAIRSRFSEELGLKVVNYQDTLSRNFHRFCTEYPSEWEMLLLPLGNMGERPVERYRKFWHGEIDSVFVPASNGSYDLSGHLMFLNYFSYRKWDPNLNIEENFFELSLQGIKFIGVQGVSIRAWPTNREARHNGRQEASTASHGTTRGDTEDAGSLTGHVSEST